MRSKSAVYSLCLAIGPLMICSGMVYTILPIYINKDLGATTTQIGFIYMVGAAAGVLFATAIGRMSDRIGRRPVILFSMITFALAFVLYALARNIIHTFPIQVVEGLSWTALGTAAPALIADIVPEEDRGWAMGVYNRTWAMGWMIGPLLGGWLADSIGFRLTLLVGSGLILIGLLRYYLKPVGQP